MSYMSLLATETKRTYSEKRAFGILIGNRLKLMREARAMDQAVVAKRLGISQSAYSKIETGVTQISAWQVAELARILGGTILTIIPPSS